MIFLNNSPIELPPGCTTVKDLIESQNIKTQGCAIAIDNKIISRDKWAETNLNDGDRVTLITAAFGG